MYDFRNVIYNIFLFLFFKEGILKRPGNNEVNIGEIKEVPKLIRVSFIRCI